MTVQVKIPPGSVAGSLIQVPMPVPAGGTVKGDFGSLGSVKVDFG